MSEYNLTDPTDDPKPQEGNDDGTLMQDEPQPHPTTPAPTPGH